MKNRKRISQIIKYWIRYSEYTQVELAKKFNITKGAFGGQLNGASPIPEKRLGELVKLLKPSSGELAKLNALLEDIEIDSTGKISTKQSPLIEMGKQIAIERQQLGLDGLDVLVLIRDKYEAELAQKEAEKALIKSEAEKELAIKNLELERADRRIAELMEGRDPPLFRKASGEQSTA